MFRLEQRIRVEQRRAVVMVLVQIQFDIRGELIEGAAVGVSGVREEPAAVHDAERRSARIQPPMSRRRHGVGIEPGVGEIGQEGADLSLWGSARNSSSWLPIVTTTAPPAAAAPACKPCRRRMVASPPVSLSIMSPST